MTKYVCIFTKGQTKPKADWRAIDSPEKRTNEFFFAVKSKKSKKQKSKKQIGSFVFWENLRHANLLTVLSDLYFTESEFLRPMIALCSLVSNWRGFHCWVSIFQWLKRFGKSLFQCNLNEINPLEILSQGDLHEYLLLLKWRNLWICLFCIMLRWIFNKTWLQ